MPPQHKVQAATLLPAFPDLCRSPATKAARHAIPSPRPLTENSPRRLPLLRAASSPAATTLGGLRGQATSSGLTSPVPGTSLAQAFASPVAPAPLPPRHGAQPAMAMAADAAPRAFASADRPSSVSVSGSVCADLLVSQPAPSASTGAEAHAAAEAGAADKQQASAIALSAAATEAGHAAAAAAQLEAALAPAAAASQVEAALVHAGAGAGSDPSSASEVEAETAAAAAEASEGLLQLLAAGEQLQGEEDGLQMSVSGTQPSPEGLAGAAAAAGRAPAGGLQAGNGACLAHSRSGPPPSSFYRQLSVEEPAMPEPALLDPAPPITGLPEDIEWHMNELLRTDPKTQEAVR